MFVYLKKIVNYFSSPDRVIVGLLYALTAIIPLYYDTASKSVFEAPKLFALRVVSLLILLLWGLLVVKRGELELPKSRVHTWFIIYAIMLFFSTLFSSYIYSSLIGNRDRFLGIFTLLNFILVFYLASQFFRTRRQIIGVMAGSLIVSSLISIWALLQTIGIIKPAAAWATNSELRAFATFGHSNHFGAYLAFHLLLAAGLFFYSQKLYQRGLLVLSALVMVPALIATSSRGALGSLIISGFGFLLFLLIFEKNLIIKQSKKIGLVLLASLIGIVIFYKPLSHFILNLGITQRTIGTIEFMRQGNLPDRVSWWRSSIQMIKERPLFGHGVSTYKESFNPYRRVDYRVPGDAQDTEVPDSAHMEYLNIAATQGLSGLLTYLLAVGLFLLAMIKTIRDNSNKERFISLAILTATISYLIQVLLNFGTISTLYFFFLFMGLGLAWSALTLPEAKSPLAFSTFKPAYRPVILVAIFILVTIGLHYSYIFIKAEYLYRSATRAANIAAGQEQSQPGEAINNYNNSLAYYDLLVETMPYEYEYWSELSDVAYNQAILQGQFSQAQYYLNISMAASRRAILIAPGQPQLHANLALVYLALVKTFKQNYQPVVARDYFIKVVEEYNKAVDYSPNNPMYVHTFGQIYLSEGFYLDAVTYLNKALALRPNYKEANFELAQAYFYLKDYDKALEQIEKANIQSPQNSDYIILENKIKANKDYRD